MDAFERASREMKTTDPTLKYFICWRCGLEKPLTTHHAIPMALKPIYNKTVPVCKDCHTEINDLYGNSFGSHLGRIKRLENQVKYFKSLYSNYRQSFESLKMKYWHLEQLYENPVELDIPITINKL